MRSFYDRIQEALARSVVLLVRQSTQFQAENHLGSQEVQQSQLKYLEAYGYSTDQAIVLRPKHGESGRLGARRPIFNRLLQLVDGGTVGMVVVARGDRFGRNALETEQLFAAAQRHGTLVCVGGKIYDPADPGDKMMLAVMAQFAEFENKARTRWMMLSRYALAARGEYATRLPSGLIWGSPDAPQFVRAMRAAGLEHWLGRLDEHHTSVRHREQTYYVLPFPDPDVFRAISLCMRWMLETGTIQEVAYRIGTDPAWPRPGQFPYTRSARWTERLKPTWKSFRHRRELRFFLRSWFRSPALYGNYYFSSRFLRTGGMLAPSDIAAVKIEGAFPSFGRPADARIVLEALSRARRDDRRGKYRGKRDYLLPEVRCAEVLESGQACGIRMSPTRMPDGIWCYSSVNCTKRGHSNGLRSTADEVVLQIALSVLEPEKIVRDVRKLRVDSGTMLARRRSLEKKVATLDIGLNAAKDKEVEARGAKDRSEEEFWGKERRSYLSAHAEAERELAELRITERDIRDGLASDVERIARLAGDLPSLVERLRVDPDRLRGLMSYLIKAVHVRRLSAYAVQLEVEFPWGGRVTRVLLTRGVRASQPEVAWIRDGTRRGITSAEIARELNEAADSDRRVPWCEERVRTTQMLLHSVPATEELTQGRRFHRVRAIARLTRADPAKVRSLMILGCLGPAVVHDGELRSAPTQAQLHRRFPSYAQRVVARAQGWPECDVMSLVDLIKASGKPRHAMIRHLEVRSGIGRDADGACYGRRSDLTRTERESFVASLHTRAPEFAALAPEHWVLLPEARRQLAPACYTTIRTNAPFVASSNPRRQWVWLGPSVRARFEERDTQGRVPQDAS